MLLGFKQKFPWGEPTMFMQKIIASVPVPEDNPQSSPGNLFQGHTPKLHTIRKSHRIQPGTLLHMATGVRTKDYFQFNENIPELQYCKSVQRIDITRKGKDVVVYIDLELMYSSAKSDDIGQSVEWFEQFCANDGLTPEQFLRYFKTSCRDWRLIHWTDLKY